MVCISHFSHISLFLAIFQVQQCVFLILHVFQCFSPYFMSYHGIFSFSSFFQFSRLNLGPTVYISPLSRLSVFLAIFQVLPCEFLIFHLFQCFSPYSRSKCVFFSFSTFFCFLPIIQVLQCVFLIIHVFNCFLAYYGAYSVSFSFCTFFSVSRHITSPTM